MVFINILIFGAPGCGKGTQSSLLTKQYHLYHLSTGDLLREVNSDTSSPFYAEVQERMAKGELVSDEIIYKIVSLKIKTIKLENKFKGIIFDGFPRTAKQAEFLSSELEKNDLQVTAVLMLNATEEIVIDRILNRFTCTKCGAVYNKVSKKPIDPAVCDNCKAQNSFSGRIDDTPEVIKNRLHIFNSNMEQLKSFYGTKMIEIDASKEPEEVFEKIKKVLEK